MKSILKLSSIALAVAMIFGSSCSKGSGESSDGADVKISTIEDQLGAPGSLNGYVELVPGDVKLEYNDLKQTIVVCAKVKVLKAGECYYPDMNVQLLDGEKSAIADFELTYESKDVLSANLKQAGNIANLQFGQKGHTYNAEAAKKAIDEWAGKAKYVIISMSSGSITPLDEEDESADAAGVGSYTLSGTVAGKDVAVVFEIAETGIVRGGYHYGKGTSGDMIELKGAYDPSDNSIVVKEEYDGKVTGTWDIVMSENYDGTVSFNGTMTNARGNTYPVILSTGGDIEEIEAAMSQASSGNSRSSSDNNIDELLDEYDRYVTKLVAMNKKMMSGDMSVMSDYQDLMETANRLSDKLSDVTGQMTSSQVARMQSIALKAAASI